MDHMFVGDFLDQYRDKGRSVPRAKYNALVFARRQLQAPLAVEGVHVLTPLAQKRARRGAVPLQPAMVRCLRQPFTKKAESRPWRRVISTMGVVAVVRQLRYAHVNRSRPVARTVHWFTFGPIREG